MTESRIACRSEDLGPKAHYFGPWTGRMVLAFRGLGFRVYGV